MIFCFLNHHFGVFVSYDDVVFRQVTGIWKKVS